MNEIIIRYFYCETKEGEILSSMVSKCLKELANELSYCISFTTVKGLFRTSESSAYHLKAVFNNEM